MIVHLTRRELETLTWLVKGKTGLEMGEIMGISKHGVAKHMRALRDKLGASTAAGVAVEACRRDLVVWAR
jgi:DNA-binding CsgD family transcriptional regulator